MMDNLSQTGNNGTQFGSSGRNDSRSCEIKRDVVEKDPTEKGDRAPF